MFKLKNRTRLLIRVFQRLVLLFLNLNQNTGLVATDFNHLKNIIHAGCLHIVHVQPIHIETIIQRNKYLFVGFSQNHRLFKNKDKNVLNSGFLTWAESLIFHLELESDL